MQSDIKHTPGPWGWQGGRLVALGGINGESEIILWPNNALHEESEQLGPEWWARTLGSCGEHTEAAAHKNAMLLAEAPALYEACKLLLMCSLPNDISGKAMIDKARSVIEKLDQ